MKKGIEESPEKAYKDESEEHFRELSKKLEVAESESRAGKSRPLREAMADIRCACRRVRIKHRS